MYIQVTRTLRLKNTKNKGQNPFIRKSYIFIPNKQDGPYIFPILSSEHINFYQLPLLVTPAKIASICLRAN